MNLSEARALFKEDPEDFEVRYGEDAVRQVLSAQMGWLPSTPRAEPEGKLFPETLKEDKWGDTAVWAAREPWEQARDRFMQAGYGGTIEIPDTSNRLLRAYMEGLDYAASVGLAGLDASDAAWKFSVGLVSEILPMGPEQEKRFTRDISSLPDAFMGTSPSRLKSTTDDFVDSGLKTLGEVERVVSENTIYYKHDPSQLNMILGVRAKNAPLKDLPVKEEYMRGATLFEPEDLLIPTARDQYAETGWFLGPDGRMRWEIPDTEAKLNQDNLKTYSRLEDHPYYIERQKQFPHYTIRELTQDYLPFTNIDSLRQVDVTSLGDLLDHPVLYEAYPELKDYVVLLGNGEVGGWQFPGGGFNVPTIYVGQEFGGNTKLDILLHEVQHAVQGLEGFETGSSAQVVLDSNVGGLLLGLKAQADSAIDQAYINAKIPDSVRKGLKSEMSKLLNDEVHSIYERSYGEAEARNTSVRRYLTEEERKDTFPEDSFKATATIYRDDNQLNRVDLNSGNPLDFLSKKFVSSWNDIISKGLLDGTRN